MIDLIQSNESVYYEADQVQKRNENQSRVVDLRLVEVR
jgi:hypothetical protein